jgi:cell division septal protein FtsQ
MVFVARVALGTVLLLRRYLLLITRLGVLLLLTLVIVLLWLVCWPVVGPFQIRRFNVRGVEKRSTDVAPALDQPGPRRLPHSG